MTHASTPNLNRAGTALLLIASLCLLAACGSSSGKGHGSQTSAAGVNVNTCDHAMQTYHNDIVSTGGNLSNDQETADQTATVRNCTRSLWLSEVSPYVGPDVNRDIVVSPTSRQKVLETFCAGNATAPACTG